MPSSLGPAEILVILVIALIVLGPSRLPEAGRQVGKALTEIRRWTQDVRSEMQGAFQPEPPTASMPTSAPVFDPMPSPTPPMPSPTPTAPATPSPPPTPALDGAPTAPIEDALLRPEPATAGGAEPAPPAPNPSPAAEPAPPGAESEAAHDEPQRPEAPADNR